MKLETLPNPDLRRKNVGDLVIFRSASNNNYVDIKSWWCGKLELMWHVANHMRETRGNTQRCLASQYLLQYVGCMYIKLYGKTQLRENNYAADVKVYKLLAEGSDIDSESRWWLQESIGINRNLVWNLGITQESQESPEIKSRIIITIISKIL